MTTLVSVVSAVVQNKILMEFFMIQSVVSMKVFYV